MLVEMRVAVCLALVLAVGCGSNVGQPCDGDDACGGGLTCLAAAPGGYCTQSCTTSGSTGECPSGSVCAPYGSRLLCAVACDGACREGYACVAVAGTTLQACLPSS